MNTPLYRHPRKGGNRFPEMAASGARRRWIPVFAGMTKLFDMVK